MSNVLIIAPHPDDEVLGCGGLIVQNIELGNVVNVIYLTSGERGIPGTSPVEATAIRENEARSVCDALGVLPEFWRYQDGDLRYNEELRDRMAASIANLAPSVVYVTHERENHPDHRNAGKIVREALKLLPNPPSCLLYEIWTPLQRVDRILNIDAAIDQKLASAKLYHSQMEANHFDTAALSLARYRGIMQGHCQYAEAFARMRPEGREDMKVAIVLLTWSPSIENPRSEYARRTLESVLENVDPGGMDLHLHIADDGSDPLHVSALVEIARFHGFEPTITNAERGGYGRSYNLATARLHSEYDLIMPIEDDWLLTRRIELEPLANAIEKSNGEIRCIRLGYIGFTQELRGRFCSAADQLFLVLDPNSPEPHVFAGHPRLETVEFERTLGVWPEGLGAGATEWELVHRWDSRVGVAWPVDLGIPASQARGAMFAHIGTVQTITIPEEVR
jgi:LmbE family N-acetylglucosaminyl deacetylase